MGEPWSSWSRAAVKLALLRALLRRTSARSVRRTIFHLIIGGMVMRCRVHRLVRSRAKKPQGAAVRRCDAFARPASVSAEPRIIFLMYSTRRKRKAVQSASIAT